MKCNQCGSIRLNKNGVLKRMRKSGLEKRQIYICKNCGAQPSKRIN